MHYCGIVSEQLYIWFPFKCLKCCESDASLVLNESYKLLCSPGLNKPSDESDSKGEEQFY